MQSKNLPVGKKYFYPICIEIRPQRVFVKIQSGVTVISPKPQLSSRLGRSLKSKVPYSSDIRGKVRLIMSQEKLQFFD